MLTEGSTRKGRGVKTTEKIVGRPGGISCSEERERERGEAVCCKFPGQTVVWCNTNPGQITPLLSPLLYNCSITTLFREINNCHNNERIISEMVRYNLVTIYLYI